MNPTPSTQPASAGWLNRDIAGMTIASFLADAGHEMVTVLLPGFLRSLGAPPQALGWIEGVADGASSFLKLGSGWFSDRVGKRKGLVAAGYLVTAAALALLAVVTIWPLVLACRVVAWMGRGLRSPLRKALLAEAAPPEVRARAFGLHRAGDTLGAVVGPLLAVWLLARLPHPSLSSPYRVIFLISFVPGAAAAGVFLWLVRERSHGRRPGLRFSHAMRGLTPEFRRLLRGVGVFGLGDYSHTLLILAATVLLTPAYGAVRAVQIAALLYVLHNVLYAAASYPAGALGDRFSKPKLLAAGYALAAATAAGVALLLSRHTASLAWLALVFAAAGVYVAVTDALEGAASADVLPATARASGYGVMGAVNGVGDFIASALVGSLWALSGALGFAAAATLMAAGAVLMFYDASVHPRRG